MSISPMFAEELGPAFVMLGVIGLVLAGLGIASLVCIPIIAGDGKGTRWGLCLGLFFALGGGFLFVGSLSSRGGGVPLFFRVEAAVPMLCGLLSLILWGLGRRHWPETLVRVFLYGIIVVGCIYVFASWVTR